MKRDHRTRTRSPQYHRRDAGIEQARQVDERDGNRGLSHAAAERLFRQVSDAAWSSGDIVTGWEGRVG